MTAEAVLVGGTALAAYAASAGLEVDLADGRRVSPVAAFGPALAALGSGGYGAAPTAALLTGAIVLELGVWLLARRSAIGALVHSVSLTASALSVYLADRIGLVLGIRSVLSILGGIVAGSVVYYLLDVLALASSARRKSLAGVSESARASLPLAVVMTSTAGLLVLVFPYLGWISFLVMFVPLLAARHEFERYGEARRTYRQTVRALAALTEGAGYVPSGHHDRVARLCADMARELGLAAEKARELELVGLLHDVGAVSLPDASDMATVGPEDIAARTGRILEETGHLARYSMVVRDAAHESGELSMEARILRIANEYDQLEGPPGTRIHALASRQGEDDADVLAALRRVTGASA